MSARWQRDTGKPYIRRANGKERAGTFRDALRLAFYREQYGIRGFYVMMQRRTGREIMAVGRTRAEIIGRLLAVGRPSQFDDWANRIKRRAQGRYP